MLGALSQFLKLRTANKEHGYNSRRTFVRLALPAQAVNKWPIIQFDRADPLPLNLLGKRKAEPD